MFTTRNPTPPAQRVRTIWAEFEGWAEAQRKSMDRRRDEITKAQDTKWKSLPSKTRAKQDEHDARKAKLLREASEDYLTKAREEWQKRLAKNNLRDEDWGEMTGLELQKIVKVLGEDADDDEPLQLVVQNVPTQPQHSIFNPAPPLSSTTRTSNLSASTSSSYTLVNPNEFSTDDELYDAVSSYISQTEESEDENISLPVAITHTDGWGLGHSRSTKFSSQNGSPDFTASSGSYDYFPQSTALTRTGMNSAPPKRPPDIDRKKARVRGPSYVGPYLNADENTEEEAFEVFKMQTRVTKIYEFHLAAAQADVELTIELQNDRKSRKPTWKADSVAKVAAHEERMVQLQKDKEEERKKIVSTERKKWLEEHERNNQRSVFGNLGRTANTASANVAEHDWEATFKKGQTVRLDAEKKVFVIDNEAEEADDDGDEAWGVPHFEAASDIRTPAPDTIRARRQSIGRSTPSGWKTKQVSSAPTTSLSSLSSQWHPEPSPPSPDAATGPPWLEETFSGTSLDYSSSYDSDDPRIPGRFPAAAMSTPVPPIPSGWGTKKSAPTATSMLKKVLSDPTSTTNSNLFKNKNSSPPESSPKAVPAVEPKPTPVSSAAGKKPVVKRGRLVSQKKVAAGKAEDDAETSPTTPTIPTKIPSQSFSSSSASSAVSPKDILQQRFAHPDDELSSTPRPQLFAKRGVASDYFSDVASTPRATVRGFDERPSALGASSWTMDNEYEHQETSWEQQHARLAKMAAPTKAAASEVRSGWGRVAKKEVEAAVEEESPWERMMRAKQQQQQVQAVVQKESEETPWQRIQRLKEQGQAPSPPKLVQGMPEEDMWAAARAQLAMSTTKVSPPKQEEEGSLWERHMKLNAQRTGNASAMSRNSVAPPAPEESVWNQVMKGRSQASQNAPQQQAEPEETPWERQMRLRGVKTGSSNSNEQPSRMQSQSVAASWGMEYEPPISKLVQQQQPESNGFWKPTGDANQSQAWGAQRKPQPSMKTSGMPGSYSAHPFDSQRRPSDPDSSEYAYYSDVPSANRSFAQPLKGAMKGAKSKLGTRSVTIEELPDDEGRPDHSLPSNSRILLDIVEPKPSVPSTMFTNIIQFGEEEEEYEEEYDGGMSSTVPTPSTAPTSPPNEVPSLDEDEWIMEQMKNGDWGHLMNGGAAPPKQTQRWPQESSAKKPAPGSQMVDSAKLFSALESMEPASISPPKAAPPAKASPPSKVAPPAPAPPAPKPAPAPAPEKPDPVVKAANQNQTKGKGKGKGKGRK